LLDGGVSVEGLYDRDALLKAAQSLLSDRERRAKSGIGAPLVWRQAASLFHGVQTQQGAYAALRVACTAGILTFVLDTAASTSIVLPSVATRLQLKRTGVTAGPGIGGTGATAGTHQVELGALNTEHQRQLLVQSQRAVVLDLPTKDADGILGLDFLTQFDAVELHWREPQLRFHPRGSIDREGWTALVAGLSECLLRPVDYGLLVMRVRVCGQEMPALLDTGAAFSALNAAAAAALGLRGDPDAQPMVVAGVSGSPMTLKVSERAVAFQGITSAGRAASLGEARPLLGDLPAFGQLGLGAGPLCLLGLDVLQGRPRLVLSASTRRLLF